MNLIPAISKLSQNSSRSSPFRVSNKSRLHSRRATQVDMRALPRGRCHLLEQLLCHTTRPKRGLCCCCFVLSAAHSVHGLETTGKFLLEAVKLLLEQDVPVRVGAVDEREGGALVVGVAEDALGELEDGGDACAAGDEGDVLRRPLSIFGGWWRPAGAGDGEGEEEGLAGGEGVDVGGGFSLGVVFYEEVDVTWFIYMDFVREKKKM